MEPRGINSRARRGVVRDIDVSVLCLQDSKVAFVPRHSGRLVAKWVYRDPKPERQPKRVMMNKWRPASASASMASPMVDATVDTQFHEMFADPLSSSKCAAMRELFPRPVARRGRAMPLASRASALTQLHY